MPIRPENRSRYPHNWSAISHRIRFVRAEGHCECVGQCDSEHEGGRCNAPHGKKIQRDNSDGAIWVIAGTVDPLEGLSNVSCMGSDGKLRWGKYVKVVLTTAHLDNTPENVDDNNLVAMCNRCHLRLDREHHARTAPKTRDRKSGQGSMF